MKAVSPVDRKVWEALMLTMLTPQELYNKLCLLSQRDSPENENEPVKKSQVKKVTRVFPRSYGPMFYIGCKIVARMETMGWPSKIHCCYRPPEEQDKLYALGRTKARCWRSPHQFYEAVDIIHATKAWGVSEEYWEALAVCVRVVAKELNVDLEHGHYWKFKDSAHIELKDWRTIRDRDDRDEHGSKRPPTEEQRFERFSEVLKTVPFTKSDLHALTQAKRFQELRDNFD